MPFFHSDGIDFRYEERGSGHPFVFQHGLGGDVLQPLSLFNPPDGIRLICLDARAHGETRPLGDPVKLNFSVFAQDVLSLLDHLHIEKAIVGGISMGAGTALHLTLRHSHRVMGMVLSRPAWTDRPNPWTVAIFSIVARLIREHGPEHGKAVFKKTQEYQTLLVESPDNASALELQFDTPRVVETVERLERIPQDVPNSDAQEWKKIQVPTLVLANELDPIHPLEYGRIIAASIPGAEFCQLTPKSTSLFQYAADCQKCIARFLTFHFLSV